MGSKVIQNLKNGNDYSYKELLHSTLNGFISLWDGFYLETQKSIIENESQFSELSLETITTLESAPYWLTTDNGELIAINNADDLENADINKTWLNE